MLGLEVLRAGLAAAHVLCGRKHRALSRARLKSETADGQKRAKGAASGERLPRALPRENASFWDRYTSIRVVFRASIYVREDAAKVAASRKSACAVSATSSNDRARRDCSRPFHRMACFYSKRQHYYSSSSSSSTHTLSLSLSLSYVRTRRDQTKRLLSLCK